jgi:sn-glycerol 3-phosphate transport system permease protein
MEKRARFRSRWLPYALIAPQLAITIVFFFLPASQALYQSLLVQDAFGTNTQFVWFENFQALFHDEDYLRSFRVTAVFSVLVAGIGLSVSLVLAVFADRVLRGAAVYKTLLIWPLRRRAGGGGDSLAVPFQSHIGRRRALAQGARDPVGSAARWQGRADHGGDRRGLEAGQLQLPFLPRGLQSIPKSLIEAAAIDGAGPVRRFATIVFPLLSPTTFFLLVVNIVYAFFDTFAIIDAATSGGPAQATQILSTRSTPTDSRVWTSAARRRSPSC